MGSESGMSEFRREAVVDSASIDLETLDASEQFVHAAPIELPASESFSAAPASMPPKRRAEPPLELDDWELDLEWRRLRGLAGAAAASFEPARAQIVPHAAHEPFRGRHRRSSHASRPEAQSEERTAPTWSLLAWAVLSFGLMGFVCGGVLLGWSYVAGRDELWSLGMPITVAGQVGLLLGLVLQLERLWQGSRYTVDKLEQVDEQLHDLKQTTALIGATHTSAAQAFYSHMSQGAHPQMLLADLKGQLDLLAVRMTENER